MAYYRIKPRWRPTGIKTPPATEALRVVVPTGEVSHIDIFPLDMPFVDYIRRLNGGDPNSRPWRFISAPNAGIFNWTRLPDGTTDLHWYEEGRIPFLNTVAFDGNVVNVLEVQDWNAVVETIDVRKYVPLYTYLERPDLVHQFTSVNKRGGLYKAGSGVTIYVPLLTRSVSFLPLETLEPFPTVPQIVTVKWSAGLNVRRQPNQASPKVTALQPGTEFTLEDYAPRGAEVWGKTAIGYVCLYTPTQKVAFSTNWEMITHAPPM